MEAASTTQCCSLHIVLQPSLHSAAASTTRCCSLHYTVLQACAASFSTTPRSIQFSCAISIDCAEHFWPEAAYASWSDCHAKQRALATMGCSAHAAVHLRSCICGGASAVHLRCICGASAAHLRCICGASAVHLRRICGASAAHLRCICGASAGYACASAAGASAAVTNLPDDVLDLVRVGAEDLPVEAGVLQLDAAAQVGGQLLRHRLR